MRPTPSARVRDVNAAPLRPERAYVLHWITAHRRLAHNFALDHSVALARELGRPLVILEALRVGYPYASDRLHRFVLEGMADDVERAAGMRATLHAYVERSPGEGSGLLAALAKDACVVVTDDYPAFFVPRMVHAAGEKLDVRLVAVDTNGILPMRLPTPMHASAYAFRRELQKLLPVQLAHFPSDDPLAQLPDRPPAKVDPAIARRWPSLGADELLDPALVPSLPVDHEVPVVPERRGGAAEGARVLARFVDSRLSRYGERASPDSDASSGLSPYLHFGHVSAHQVFAAVVGSRLDGARLVPNAGKREGYYGLDAPTEAFLDQLVTWRELSFHLALHRADHERYESLPEWARASLDAARADERAYVYDEATLEAARTHDPIWNAAQRELRQTGTIHNYLRMLWGKKILEWSATPEEAFRVMIRLNDRWALDGRDPNSYASIGWVLGRFDRPWAPKRPVFGAIRYMSSASTVKKLDLDRYLARFGEDANEFSLEPPPARPSRLGRARRVAAK